MHGRLGIVRVVELWHGIRERRVLRASKGVSSKTENMRQAHIAGICANSPAGNEPTHLRFYESLPRKGRNVRIQVLLRLRHAWGVGL